MMRRDTLVRPGSYCAIALMIVASAGWAQPSVSPVPSNLLRGGTLVIMDGNFEVSAPGAGWKWQVLHVSQPQARVADSYVCVDPLKKTVIVVTVQGGNVKAIDGEFLKGFLASITETGAEPAATLHDERVDTPVRGSVHYRYARNYPGRGIQQTYGYLIPTGKLVNLTAITSAAAEPPEFVGFVRSFRLLHPVPDEQPQNVSVFGYLVLLFLIAAVCSLINSWKGRVVVNPFAAASWVVATVLVLDLVAVIIVASANEVHEPYEAGRIVGSVLGSALIPLIVGVVLANRGLKKNVKEAVPPVSQTP